MGRKKNEFPITERLFAFGERFEPLKIIKKTKLKDMQTDSKNKKGNEANTLLPAVNFTDFCKKANLYQIKKALKFYNEPFKVEKVLEYFANWTIVYDDSQWKNGKILTNKHSTENWETIMTINDDAEYMFADNENCWQYLPKTFSEFISDVLRYEDFDLLLSEKGRSKIYGR